MDVGFDPRSLWRLTGAFLLSRTGCGSGCITFWWGSPAVPLIISLQEKQKWNILQKPSSKRSSVQLCLNIKLELMCFYQMSWWNTIKGQCIALIKVKFHNEFFLQGSRDESVTYITSLPSELAFQTNEMNPPGCGRRAEGAVLCIPAAHCDTKKSRRSLQILWLTFHCVWQQEGTFRGKRSLH